MEDVICIITCEAIVILDMQAMVENEEDWEKERPVRSPPVKKLIKFEDENLPIAMGCLKSGNTLYMFGGESLTEDSFKDGGGCIRLGSGNPGYYVMKLDLCNPHSKPTCVGQLKAPKLLPYVFEFNSKIYILSRHPDSFEVWDPVTAESFVLPYPPFRVLCLRGHFLTERGIVMAVTDFTALFFNIHDETWETWKYSTSRQMNLQDWVRLQGVLAAGNNDFVLRISGVKLLLVNMLKTSENQSWDLNEKYRDLRGEYHIALNLACIPDYRELGQGRGGPRYNCLLLPCLKYGFGTIMRIIIDVFRVHKNTGEKSFSLISLRIQVYEFNYDTYRNDLYPFHLAHM